MAVEADIIHVIGNRINITPIIKDAFTTFRLS
jgi:hypothetical protein